MKKQMFLLSFSASVVLLLLAFRPPLVPAKDSLSGAWEKKQGDAEQVILFADGYFTHTVYSKSKRQFTRSRGGTYTIGSNELRVQYEFDTKEKDRVGETVTYPLSVAQGKLTLNLSGEAESWDRVDAGEDRLAGLWKITARKQDGGLVAIHQAGTRKTIKILTPTRFQWAAIDPGTKQFMGTGGGRYTFQDGKYTEHIEFFSRDSSRVGSALSFDGKLESGDWHHSGLSSRGEPIYEVWSRTSKASN